VQSQLQLWLKQRHQHHSALGEKKTQKEKRNEFI
jgi:hypothetical protein